MLDAELFRRIEQNKRDCVFGIKAVQNFHIAEMHFRKMDEHLSKGNTDEGSAFFYSATVRYCKPFTRQNFKDGAGSYPQRKVKGAAGVDWAAHTHIMKARNEMIAHEDMIENKAVMCIARTKSAEDLLTSVTMIVASRSIRSPATPEICKSLIDHVTAIHLAARNALHEDLAIRAQFIFAGHDVTSGDTTKNEHYPLQAGEPVFIDPLKYHSVPALDPKFGTNSFDELIEYSTFTPVILDGV